MDDAAEQLLEDIILDLDGYYPHQLAQKIIERLTAAAYVITRRTNVRISALVSPNNVYWPEGGAMPLTNEQKLAKIEWLANTWFENYDANAAQDLRNPSERDIAYDDAAFQILHILGKV